MNGSWFCVSTPLVHRRPSSPRPPHHRIRPHGKAPHQGGVRGVVLIGLILATLVGVIGYRVFYDSTPRLDPASLITQLASRGPFDHIVLEQGEVESSKNREIVCEVKSRGTPGVSILWVIDEGARVKKGDKLVELDTSQLELKLKEQRIQVITKEAQVATAEALLKQAEISKKEYLQGIFVTEERAIESEIQIAKQTMTRSTLSLHSTQRLVAKGLVKKLQMQADEYAVANAKTQLDSATNRLKVLRKFTREKFLVQYDSGIAAAKASLKASSSELLEENNEREEIEQQIEKCVMHAPADGVVVHANKFSNRGGRAEFVVEAGSVVRERQAIIRCQTPPRCRSNVTSTNLASL